LFHQSFSRWRLHTRKKTENKWGRQCSGASQHAHNGLRDNSKRTEVAVELLAPRKRRLTAATTCCRRPPQRFYKPTPAAGLGPSGSRFRLPFELFYQFFRGQLRLLAL
jgi:hypothetical protein